MRTTQPYKLIFRNYTDITVPAGTQLTHQTAMGFDAKYHFVNEFEWIDALYPEIAQGLKMDAQSYGIDVPVEYTDQLTAEYALRYMLETLEEQLTEEAKENESIIHAIKVAKTALIP